MISSHEVEFESGGVRLRGSRWPGSPGGLTVVLLHGGGQTRHSWKRTAERLSRLGHTAISFDARGHGDSDWHDRKDYSIDAFVDDLLAVAGTLECPPVFVGASLGGITALLTEGEHPGTAAAIVLVDVVPRVESTGVDRIRAFMTERSAEGFASLDDVADAIAAYNPHRSRPRRLDGLRKNVRQGSDGRWYWHWDPEFMRGVDDEPRRHTDPERLRTAAASLSVPVLVVRGRESDVVSDAGIADMLELVPHAHVLDVHAAGHMVAGDDNDVFATHLEVFLRRVAADPAA